MPAKLAAAFSNDPARHTSCDPRRLSHNADDAIVGGVWISLGVNIPQLTHGCRCVVPVVVKGNGPGSQPFGRTGVIAWCLDANI